MTPIAKVCFAVYLFASVLQYRAMHESYDQGYCGKCRDKFPISKVWRNIELALRVSLHSAVFAFILGLVLSAIFQVIYFGK